MPRTVPFVVIVVLLFAAPAFARPWTIGGGGGFQMNEYDVFLPNGTISAFAETPLAPAVVVRIVGGYAWYVWDTSVQAQVEQVASAGGPSWPTLGIASFGATLRLRATNRGRTVPFVEAGPALCWSRWHERPFGYGVAGDRVIRASKILPGLEWGAGFEVRPGDRVRMEFGVTGLVTSAPGKVDLPLLSGEWVRGVRQVALSASLGWKI